MRFLGLCLLLSISSIASDITVIPPLDTCPQNMALLATREFQALSLGGQADSLFFMYELPGLRLMIEHSPFGDMFNGDKVKMRNFRLVYEPTKFFKTSIVRRTLGEEALDYSTDDVRMLSTSILSGEGEMLDVYLKGPPSKGWRDKYGGLLMISIKTRKVLFYPPGTNVDATAAGLLHRSAKAVFDLTKGIGGEIQNMMRRTSGYWISGQELQRLHGSTLYLENSGLPSARGPTSLPGSETAPALLPQEKAP